MKKVQRAPSPNSTIFKFIAHPPYEQLIVNTAHCPLGSMARTHWVNDGTGHGICLCDRVQGQLPGT